MPPWALPAVLAVAAPTLAGIGAGLYKLLRALWRWAIGKVRAWVRRQFVAAVDEAVAPAVAEALAEIRAVRQDLEKVAVRTFVLEQRPGGRRRTDPPPAPSGPSAPAGGPSATPR